MPELVDMYRNLAGFERTVTHFSRCRFFWLATTGGSESFRKPHSMLLARRTLAERLQISIIRPYSAFTADQVFEANPLWSRVWPRDFGSRKIHSGLPVLFAKYTDPAACWPTRPPSWERFHLTTPVCCSGRVGTTSKKDFLLQKAPGSL